MSDTALRLADALLEDAADHLETSRQWDMRPEDTINHRHFMNATDAAAELRRLHAENEALREANEAFGKRQEWWNDKMVALEERNDELVEALRSLSDEVERFGLHHPNGNSNWWPITLEKAQAALAKVGENNGS